MNDRQSQEMDFSNFKASSEEQAELIKMVNTVMPFGKYKGTKLLHIPEYYLVWFHGKGFPEGKLGEYLSLLYEIKLNGLEKMLAPLLIEDPASS